MKYTNIFYVPHFNIIGGIETYCYELAKKYKDKDITFVYSDETSDRKQLNRIRKYCRALKTYTDIELGERIQQGHLLPCKITKARAEYLKELNLVESE